jgi:hypothetical protein
MSSQETRALIVQAVERFGAEVPALRNLKLVIRLELRSRNDSPIWRVELPGPEISKEAGGDAKVDVSVARPDFNRLASEGTLKDWASAYERGQVRVSGDPGVIKLIGNVALRQMARGRTLHSP